MQLALENVSYAYQGSPVRPALANLSLTVSPGQFIAVIGPSGCGKSTLLRLLADLLQPTTGTIRLDGAPPSEAAAARRIAWMAQSPALLPWLTSLQNIALSKQIGRAKNGTRLAAQEALQRVGLADSAHAYPFMLSGGMQQRLALARLLCQEADLWLMDEPFAALDELTREGLAAELLQLWQPLHPTVLWVTHNIHEALRLADRVLVFSAHPGQLVADLSISLARPRSEFDPSFQNLLQRLRSSLGKQTSSPSGGLS